MDTKRTVWEIENIIVQSEQPIRSKIIVPNVSWGFFDSHEADFVVISSSLYLTEYEIKRSFEDFKNDFKKKDYHNDKRISKLWYVVPESVGEKCKNYLESQYEWIGSEHAGIRVYNETNYNLKTILECNYTKGKKLYLEDALDIARLGTLRYWTLRSTQNTRKPL